VGFLLLKSAVALVEIIIVYIAVRAVAGTD
jgi:hypothetical protein